MADSDWLFVKRNKTTGQYKTDEEGGGGSSHTYSTTEQEVATWIDGKPVYEKTITGESISAGSSGTKDLSSLHIDTFLGIDTSASYFIRSDNSQVLTLNYALPTNAQYGLAVSYGSGNLLVETKNFGISSYVVTCHYTKSTT